MMAYPQLHKKTLTPNPTPCLPAVPPMPAVLSSKASPGGLQHAPEEERNLRLPRNRTC